MGGFLGSLGLFSFGDWIGVGIGFCSGSCHHQSRDVRGLKGWLECFVWVSMVVDLV